MNPHEYRPRLINGGAPTTPSSQLAIRSTMLPLEIPPDFEEKVKGFSFDWNHLLTLMQNEAHHFAVKYADNCVRVFTRHCVFNINLDTNEAQVALPETVWLAELLSRAQKEAHAVSEMEKAEKRAYLTEKRQAEAEIELANADEDILTLTKQLACARKAQMRLVSKFRGKTRPKKGAKA